jgi:epoxyqueuosine reductase
MPTKTVHDWAASRGLASRVADFSALELVRSRLARLASEGALDAGFVRTSLGDFRYPEGRKDRAPRSLVLLALPRPAHVVTFSPAGRELDLLLPPTYASYHPVFDRVRDWFRTDLGLRPDQAVLLNAPLKSLAAAAGLVRYGRNNIGYVDGLGSYVQLIGLAVGVPLEPDGDLFPIEERALPLCGSCRLCARACPGLAVSRDRFLLRAERCFTIFSESPDPIPDSIVSPSPDCLIGCLACQEACPANKGLLKREHSGVVFDLEETEAMLSEAGPRRSPLWPQIRAKFSTLETTEDIDLFARNLRFVVGGRG